MFSAVHLWPFSWSPLGQLLDPCAKLGHLTCYVGVDANETALGLGDHIVVKKEIAYGRFRGYLRLATAARQRFPNNLLALFIIVATITRAFVTRSSSRFD